MRTELEELLGGPATAEKIDNRGLCLVTRADGEKEGLPCQYILRKFGRGPELIFGDCAVVRMTQDLRLLSVRAQDGETAREIIGVVRA